MSVFTCYTEDYFGALEQVKHDQGKIFGQIYLGVSFTKFWWDLCLSKYI